MAEFDVLIRAGTVVDGTRMPRYVADIGITDGRIAEIGRIAAHRAAKVIEADGLVVAPGFVDLHTHYDAQLFWDPCFSISSWHGVTSVVIGNCGFGFAPMRPADRERAMLTMTRVEAIPYASMKAGMPWDWVTYPEFLDSVDRRPKAVNVLPYVPVSPLLVWVMGFEDAKKRRTTEEEESELRRLLDEAMNAGGCGWSAQRLDPNGPACVQRDFDGSPMVSDVMSDETCYGLARVLGQRNEGFIQMTLTTDSQRRDFAHFEELARISGRPILWNVVQPRDNRPQVHRRILSWLEECRRKGLRVYGQGVTTVDGGFAFTFKDWNLFDDSQPWCEATTGTSEERKAKLADPKRRVELKAHPPYITVTDLGKIFVSGVNREELKPCEGLTLRELSEKQGRNPIDAMLDLAVADDLETEFYLPQISENVEYVKEMLSYPWIIPGVSDGGAHTKFFTGGKYPTEFLATWVREHGFLSLEEAHWRLSALPAYCAGFRNRGVLREGSPADVVIYDYERLSVSPMEVTRDFPGEEWRRVQRADGYRNVLVNGQITLEDGHPTGNFSGKLLRHGE